MGVGTFPYSCTSTIFDLLYNVVSGEAPRLPSDTHLSGKFVDFVHKCLTHLVEDRPKLKDLIEHELLLAAEKEVDVSKWYTEILEKEKDVSKPDLCTS